MRLIDNSGGFWTDLIVRRKNPNLLINSRMIPNEAFRIAMANEAISSIRGSRRHIFVARVVNGKVVLQSFSSGTYPNGILKRRSPDGVPWEPLKESTIRAREYRGNTRGPEYALRATDQHIYYGLKILRVGRTQTEIGWEGQDAEIADAQDSGFETYGPIFGRETSKAMVVVARRFRGFQSQFIETFFAAMKAFTEATQ